jgi:hypothetical protein
MWSFSVMPSPPVLIVNFVDGTDGTNVRMIQGRGCLGFALKAAERLGVSGYIVRQDLRATKWQSFMSPALYITPLQPPPSFSTMR